MNNLQHTQGGCLAYSSGAWAEGTNAATIKSTATVVFTIDGVFKSKSATDNIAISFSQSGLYSQDSIAAAGGFVGGANGSTRLYGVFLDSAGAVTIVPGKTCDTVALAAGTESLQFPAPQRNKACSAVLRIVATSGTTFVPGTTDLGAAGITATWLDVSAVPAEPLRA